MFAMRWQHLLFLHWSVPVDALRKLVPPALEIDTFRGRAYVTLAPLAMSELRGEGLSGMLGSLAFDEVNVRTYVRHARGIPGVWFFSLDASSILAVEGARLFNGLPYFHANVSLRGRDDGGIELQCERIAPAPVPAKAWIRYEPDRSSPHVAKAGTLEHFLIERYALYVQRGGVVEQVRVEHEPYALHKVVVHELDESMVAAAGIERPRRPPRAHYVQRLDVRALWPEVVGEAVA